MRMWPYQLLNVIPNKHLVSQWRECLAITGNIYLKGNPNNYIVNRIMNYPISHLAYYCQLVIDEMINREFKIGKNALYKLDRNIDFSNIKYKIIRCSENKSNTFITVDENILFEDWHNFRYTKQCKYSFEERYDCGAITKEEWSNINNKFIKMSLVNQGI